MRACHSKTTGKEWITVRHSKSYHSGFWMQPGYKAGIHFLYRQGSVSALFYFSQRLFPEGTVSQGPRLTLPRPKT
jgi:hypothetical protein